MKKEYITPSTDLVVAAVRESFLLTASIGGDATDFGGINTGLGSGSDEYEEVLTNGQSSEWDNSDF